MSESLPSHETFELAYSKRAPWEVGHPQQAIVDAAEWIDGSILDVGCGTGENAIHFAQLGHRVRGIDFVAQAIEKAQLKAVERHAAVEFRVDDALQLERWTETFDTVIDCGLFHVFSDADRAVYVRGLHHVTRAPHAGQPGGHLLVHCFRDDEPGSQGPRRISAAELRQAFAPGWELCELRKVRYETRTDLKDFQFSADGAKAWLGIFRRL